MNKGTLLASVAAQALLASGGGGGGGNMPVDAAHRYWRLRVVAGRQQDSYYGVSGLQLYEKGVNRAPGSTLTANRVVQAGSLASVLAYDANSLVQFAAAQYDPIIYTFDLGTPRNIDTVGVYPNRDSSGRSPGAMWIEWSDDGNAWTPKAWVRKTDGYTVGSEEVFAIPALKPIAPVWAIWGWNPTGSMGELEMLKGGVDLTSGKTAFASSNYSDSENAAKAIDDDANTNWSGGNDNDVVTLGVDFGSSVQPEAVAIQSRNDSQYWSQTPWKNIWFGYGDDRKTFRVKKELTGNPAVNPYTGAVQKVTYQVPVWTSGPSANAHRYWRVRGLSVGGGDNAQYSEIEFRSEPGGPTLTTGGTPIASTWYDMPSGTYWQPSNAYDGNIATNWAAQGMIGQWIGYDFGKKVDVAEVAMRQSSAADQYWSSMSLDYSDDATTWTQFALLLSSPKIDGWRTYTPFREGAPDEGWNLAHRYWRYVTLQWPSNYQGVNEIRLMNGATDLIAANGGSASADTAQNPYVASRAFDNDPATGWADNGTGDSHWLKWDFGAGKAFAVTGYTLTAWPGLMPIGWQLQFSDDDATWKVADTRLSQDQFSGQETRTYTPGPPVPAIRTYSGLGFELKGAWGLRRLVDGYNGPLVRVRDTTTNAESDIGIGASGKMAAFTGTPAIVKVYDQSGNGADIGQAEAARQPLLVGNQTKDGGPVIRFDGGDDYLFDPVAAVDRPYMTPKIVSNQIWARAAGTEAYGAGVHIPHRGGANENPYKRWGWDFSGTGPQINYRNNAFTGFSYAAGDAQFPFMTGTSGKGALQVWDNYVRMTGIPGVNVNTSRDNNLYPNPTGLYICGNGAGDENFAADFVELVMGVPGSGNIDTFCEECDKIVCALIFDDYEIQTVTVKTPGTANNAGVSAGEIEMLAEDGTDLSSGALAYYGTHRYSASESWQHAFDDNPNSLWSGEGNTYWPVLTMRLAAPMQRALPTHGSHRVRNDSYVYAGSIKRMYFSALTKNGWVRSQDIVLPDNPVAGQLTNFLVSYDPTPVVWDSMYIGSPSAESNGWDGYTLRARIAASVFVVKYRYVKFKFKASPGAPLVITKAALGFGSSADYSMVGPPVPVKFGGQDSITVPAGGEFWTDPIDTASLGDMNASGRRLQFNMLVGSGGFMVVSDNQRAITGSRQGDYVTQQAATGFGSISSERSAIIEIQGTTAI